MATKKTDTLIEHKIFNVNMPFPKQGVNFNWCHQNYTSFHDHDYYEFVIVTDGKVKHILKGTTSIAAQGMFFLIKPGEFHQFLPYHNHHSKHINFCISAPAMQEISKVFWLKDMSDTVDNWVLPNDLFLPQKDFESILNSINRLSQFPVHSQNSFAVIKSIIIELLLFLFQKSNTQKTLTNNRVYPAWLNIFLDTLSDPKVFTRQLKDIYPLAPYSRAMLNTHFKNYVAPDLKNKAGAWNSAADSSSGSGQAYGVVLGDVTWNAPDSHKSAMKAAMEVGDTGVYWYTAPGNHDWYQSDTDTSPSIEEFKNIFGPTRISFDRGDMHIVVMNNVYTVGNKAQSNYEAGFTEEEFKWLQNDLSHVDKSKGVVLCVHIPFRNGAASGGANHNI